MLDQLSMAGALTVATTAVHSGFTVLTLRAIKGIPDDSWYMQAIWRQVALLAVLVLGLLLALLLEAGLWALAYVAVDAMESFEPALYFSIVTFTTLGYGDMVLDEHWRILGTFEAANGIVMMGWTTAILMAAVQHVHQVNVRQRGS